MDVITYPCPNHNARMFMVSLRLNKWIWNMARVLGIMILSTRHTVSIAVAHGLAFIWRQDICNKYKLADVIT